MDYTHPVFDADAMIARQQLTGLQGTDRIWYCGSYFGYGFHEDALRSAVVVARLLGVDIPWSLPAAAGPAILPGARPAWATP
jgi:predicted NAD/FAD-binding protein